MTVYRGGTASGTDDHRDFDIAETGWILSQSHIGIRENGIMGKGIRFEITLPKG